MRRRSRLDRAVTSRPWVLRYGAVLLLITSIVAGVAFAAIGDDNLGDSIRTFLQALRRAL